jgi:soluble lytic murein transglycosylase-like protein
VATERTHGAPAHQAGAPRRDDLRSLLARPWVQALLLTTAVVSTVGVTATKGKEASRAQYPAGAVSDAAVADESGAEIDETVEAAWRRRAMERESQKLLTQFAKGGYRVSPELALSIHEAAVRHEIKPEIAFGLVRAESGFRNSATSPVGAVGLTQLMPRTASWIEPGVTREQLRDPDVNLDVGFKYLRYLIDRYRGDETLALLAYNRGPGTVDRALRSGKSPDNGYAAFVRGEANHGHKLFTSQTRAAAPKKVASNTRAKPATAKKVASNTRAKPAAAKKAAPNARAKPATAKKAAPNARAKPAAAKKAAPKKAPPKRPAPRNTKRAR